MSEHDDNARWEVAANHEEGADGFEYPEELDPPVCRGIVVCPNIAAALRAVFVGLVEAGDGNPTRTHVALLRLAGVSYRDIGVRLGMSQEAAHKHVRCICRRNHAMAAVFALPGGKSPAFLGDDKSFDIKRKAMEGLRHGQHD